jgi:hypothetical protein
VDAISHSKVGGSSAVFTLEDDSPAGNDHVDGLWRFAQSDTSR